MDAVAVLPAALAGVFAWAAAAKALAPGRWLAALAAYRLGPLRGAAAVAVPTAEAAVALLVVAGAPGPASWLAVGLLAAFSAAVLRARRLHGDRLPCGCFGRSRPRDYRVVLARNAALGAGAVGTLATGASFPALRWISLPGPGEAMPAALALLGLAAGAWTLRGALASLGGDRGQRPASAGRG